MLGGVSSFAYLGTVLSSEAIAMGLGASGGELGQQAVTLFQTIA